MGKRKESVFTITNLQETDEVTGSCMLVEVGGAKLMLDCGLLQDDRLPFEMLYKANSNIDKVDLSEIDMVIVGHQNYDHLAGLPFFAQENRGFKGKIVMTAVASELAGHILRDGTKIHIADTKRYNCLYNKHLEPLYTEEDTEKVINMIQGYSYNQKIYINDKVYVELLPSGHLAGSALIYITYIDDYSNKHMMYCPDMYYGDMPRAYTKTIIEKTYKANVVVLEATYGNKTNHGTENPKTILEQAILKHIVQDHKQIFIPVFSMQRSTQILKLLDEIYKTNEEIRQFNAPIYMCGKLAKLCHESMGKKEYMDFYNDKDNEDRGIFDNPKFGFITTPTDLDHFVLNNSTKITLASAGSCNAGFSNSIMQSFIPNKTVKILGCGYIFPESVLDRTIKNSTKVTVNGKGLTKRCEFLGILPNLSGHVDLENNIKWIKSFDQHVLKTVIITHGDKESRENLKNELIKTLNNKNIICPNYGQIIKC